MKAKRTPTGVTPTSAKSSKDILQENAPRPTGEKQPNRFARRSLKFTVCVIMLGYIASSNKYQTKCGKMCKFSILCDRLFSLSVFLSLNLLSVL